MAYYEVTCSCGHTRRVQLYGKQSDREYRMRMMERLPCSECDIAARSAAGRDEDITGSDKQVAWAHDIRARMLEGIDSHRRAFPEAKEALKDWVRGHTEARWYIDHQFVDDLDEIFRLMPSGEQQALVQSVAAKVKERTVA